MGYLWRGTCEGCHRTSSFMEPAPGTPDAEVRANLYCPECFNRGRAVYRTPAEQSERDRASLTFAFAVLALAGFVLCVIVPLARELWR